jgi:Kef-type K+ transport system membrane component KefB
VRLGLPAIVGELLVGVGLGPHALDWVKVDQATAVLSQLGIVVLLFVAGLETRLSDLLSVGRTSALASVGGMVAAGGSGFAIVAAFGYPAHPGRRPFTRKALATPPEGSGRDEGDDG